MKLIIDNRTTLSDAEALSRVCQVVATGKISKGRFGEQYCFGTVFDDKIVVWTTRNRKSERFTIVPDRNPFNHPAT